MRQRSKRAVWIQSGCWDSCWTQAWLFVSLPRPAWKSGPGPGFVRQHFLLCPHNLSWESGEEPAAVFHDPVSPVTQGLRRLVSCSVFPRAVVLPLGGPLSLLSVRLNSLVVILIISVWGCFQLPPDLQKAKNRKLFFFLFWNTFSVKG